MPFINISGVCAGFSEVMASLAKIGFFDAEPHPMLKGGQRPTFGTFLNELLDTKCSSPVNANNLAGSTGDEKEMVKRLILSGHCKETATAVKTVKTIKLLAAAHSCANV